MWCGYPSPLVALRGADTATLAAIVGIALLFTYFSGDCPAPDTILSITLILVVFATLSQLFVSKDANLLTSSVAPCIWLSAASSAVAANPVDKVQRVPSQGRRLGLGLCGVVRDIDPASTTRVYSESATVKYLQDGKPAADNAPGGDTMHKMPPVK